MGIADLARHGAAVGLRLHARFYPTGGGLRDAAQLDLLRRLREMGCAYGQGFLLARPMPASKLRRYLHPAPAATPRVRATRGTAPAPVPAPARRARVTS